MELGHTCVNIPDAVDSVTKGDPATLQIKYTADFDKPYNQTFYACADITYVLAKDFHTKVPCFNATEPEDGSTGNKNEWDFHDENGYEDLGDGTDKGSSSSKKSSGGLSKGAIAGIVVGVIGGLGFIGAAAFFIYRRKNQRLQEIRKQNSSRGVSWNSQNKPTASESSDSVRMQSMSA